jgi:hypothetical protein
VQLKGLGQLKNPLTSSGIELSDFEYEACGRTDGQTYIKRLIRAAYMIP